MLMTYHKLVERDAKNVDIQWKGESFELIAQFKIIDQRRLNFSGVNHTSCIGNLQFAWHFLQL